MRHAENGIALLEVLVALAILGGAGTALVGALAAGVRSEHEIREREMAIATADRVLTATALLSRTDLDRRIGRHSVGGLLVEVQRPEPALYRIGISDVGRSELETLVTVVYRPEAPAR
jgi:type II secretory pathway pseudopilin PulG